MSKGLKALKHFENELILNKNYDFKDIDIIERELKVLDILKYRINLKEDAIKGAYFTINEEGLPEIYRNVLLEKNTEDYDIAWVEASGFVFKDSDEYKLLKEWLENEQRFRSVR